MSLLMQMSCLMKGIWLCQQAQVKNRFNHAFKVTDVFLIVNPVSSYNPVSNCYR